jgi:DNA primase
MSVVDEVKQRTDIVEIASQYTTLTKAGHNFKGLCPFHSEKHPSFFVYPEQQSWHCFGACNTGGDVFSLIMKKEGLDFGEVLRRTAERAGVTIPKTTRQAADKEKYERLYQANELAAQYFHEQLLNSPEAKKARNYVARRGVSDRANQAFRLGYGPNNWQALKQYLAERGYSESELVTAGLIIETEPGTSHDRFRNKLMFPIHDAKGRVTGFGARVLDDSLPKYTNSPETPVFNKSGLLYGIDLAAEAIRQQGRAVIVEGYMDVIAAHDNGFNNVIASMGTSITEKQVSILKRLTKNIILALDADTAGEKATLRSLGYENLLDAEIKAAILPDEKDPDDIIKENKNTWQLIINNATPIFDYVFKHNISGFDLSTKEGKYSTIESFLSLINEVQDNVHHRYSLKKLHMSDYYTKMLADLIGSSHQEIKSYIAAYFKTQPFKKHEKEGSISTKIPHISNPREEYCLALLLQHPELKPLSRNLLVDYFESSQNREVFNAYQKTENTASLKDKLDSAIWEYLDSLMQRSLRNDKVEARLSDCILRLREDYLRRLERKREAVFASEAASSGSSAALSKLEEQGTEGSSQLMDIFIQRSRGGQQHRRSK